MFTPLYEWRTGFPWSAVNEFQDYVGTRNEAGRLPTVSHARFLSGATARVFASTASSGGIKIYNAFASGSNRDVQNNITSPDYGTFYNPIQRSIGFVIGGSKP